MIRIKNSQEEVFSKLFPLVIDQFCTPAAAL